MPRSVEVNGVTVSIDDDKGGHIVYGDKSDLGKGIDLYGGTGKPTIHAGFVEYGDKVVAIVPQADPGNYRVYGAGAGHDITIVPGYVTQEAKRKY